MHKGLTLISEKDNVGWYHWCFETDEHGTLLGESAIYSNMWACNNFSSYIFKCNFDLFSVVINEWLEPYVPKWKQYTKGCNIQCINTGNDINPVPPTLAAWNYLF